MIRIIIVDDHRFFRTSLKAAFETGHPDLCIAGEASCGEELFCVLASTPAEVVLLDINLPDMWGVEVARRLCREYPEVKVLAVSAENTAETIQAMIEAGIHGFISKRNGDHNELAEAIRSVVSGVEYFGRDIAAIIFDLYVSKKKTVAVTNEFSEREREIITLCSKGLIFKEIAAKLGISHNTVNTHKKNIFQKLGIHSKLEMVQYAMKHGIIFQLIFLLLAVACHSQRNNNEQPVKTAVVADSLFVPTGNARLDSLLQLAAVAKRDTNLVKLYDQIAHIYENKNMEKTKEYHWKLKNLSEQLDWNKGRYMFASYFSVMLCREGLLDSALVILAPALELAKKENDEGWLEELYFYTGETYKTKGWFETALNYYMEAVSIFERTNNSAKLGNIYISMSELYRNIYLLEKAIEYGEKALVLTGENQFNLSILATAYSMSYQYEKGNEYYEKALAICVEQNDIYSMEYICLQLADNYRQLFDLNKYEMYLNKVLEIFGSVDNMYFDFLYMGMLGQLEKMKGNFAKAEKDILQALEFAIKHENLEYQRTCYFLLAELSLAQHKYLDNIRYEIEREKVDQVMALETSVHAVTEMAAKYETAKKELEIENQKQIIKSQNLQRGFLVSGIALSLVILALLWYMLRLRIRRNRALTERNDALAEINATKDKFFNIISHDLKNPVLAQRDALRLLVANSRSWDADRLAEYHTGLLKATEEQTELVYNLLGWAQLQTGRIGFTPGVFSLSSRLHSDIALLRNMAEYKGITFVADIPDNVLVTGDANMLSTVVRNLLANAIKFTATGGTVTLEISACTGAVGASPTKYTVLIADTGTGMSEDQIRNLFCIDTPQSRPGTAGECGSGLGLIVCKEFLEKHGAILHVESEVGKGSRFWFELKIESHSF